MHTEHTPSPSPQPNIDASVGFYAGSFDPWTKGHRDVAEQAGKAFREVVIGVGTNPRKSPLFTAEERVALIAADLRGLSGRFRVIAYEGATVTAAIANGAGTLIRGARSVTDWESELDQANLNHLLSGAHKINTFLVPTRAELGFTSSSVVKEVAQLNFDLSRFVSPSIEAALRERLRVNAMHAELKEWWSDLRVRTKIIPEDWQIEFSNILKAYTGRAYHNTEHLYEMYQLFKQYCAALDNPTRVALAIFYHDETYDTEAIPPANEEASARQAESRLTEFGWRSDLVAQVVKDIRATAQHALLDNAKDQAYFLDFDLAILGSSPERYQRYATAIREEYAWVDPATYQSKRIEVLNGLLNKEPLFFTEALAERFIDTARTNMQNEIDWLVTQG